MLFAVLLKNVKSKIAFGKGCFIDALVRNPLLLS